MATKSKEGAHPKTKSRSAPCTPSSPSRGRKKQLGSKEPAAGNDNASPMQEEKPMPRYLMPTISSCKHSSSQLQVKSPSPSAGKSGQAHQRLKASISPKPKASVAAVSKTVSKGASHGTNETVSEGASHGTNGREAVKAPQEVKALPADKEEETTLRHEVFEEATGEEGEANKSTVDVGKAMVADPRNSDKVTGVQIAMPSTSEEPAADSNVVVGKASASKLTQRRNKVHALVGAFENPLHEAESQHSPRTSPKKDGEESQHGQQDREGRVNHDEGGQKSQNDEIGQHGQQNTNEETVMTENDGGGKNAMNVDQEEEIQERAVKTEEGTESVKVPEKVTEEMSEFAVEESTIVEEATMGDDTNVTGKVVGSVVNGKGESFTESDSAI